MLQIGRKFLTLINRIVFYVSYITRQVVRFDKCRNCLRTAKTEILQETTLGKLIKKKNV